MNFSQCTDKHRATENAAQFTAKQNENILTNDKQLLKQRTYESSRVKPNERRTRRQQKVIKTTLQHTRN